MEENVSFSKYWKYDFDKKNDICMEAIMLSFNTYLWKKKNYFLYMCTLQSIDANKSNGYVQR